MTDLDEQKGWTAEKLKKGNGVGEKDRSTVCR